MKKHLVIVLSVILIIAVIGVVVFAVGFAMHKQKEAEPITATNDSVQSGATVSPTLYSDHYKVGVVQTGLGSASKDCYGGFMFELDENNLLGNLEVVYIVEDNEELCRNKIQGLIDEGCDLLYTIGRYASQTAAELTKDIPIVFGAVNSPDEVGLVESNEVPGGNVTGVSSYTPCFEQIDLIQTIMPSVKSVAVLYGATDEDAVLQGIIAAREAKNIGLTCTQYPIEDKAALESTLKKIKDEKIESIYLPIDKFLSSNLSTIIEFSNENKIPVVGGDESTIAQGALATSVINYESIGRMAAGMVQDILFEKKDIKTIPVAYKHDCTNIVNKTVRDKLGIEIPATALGEVELWEAPTEEPTAAPPPTEAATAAEPAAEATTAE